jgi:methionine--tRNA ligase
LVGIFGNFINRVTVLTQKYYNGIVPQPNEFEQVDKDLFHEIQQIPEKIGKNLDEFRFRDALTEMMNLARLGNKYLADEEPWKVIKDNPERVKTQMFCALQVAGALAYLCEPFLPFTSQKMKSGLNLGNKNWYEVLNTPPIPTGHQINEMPLLFSKIEDDVIEAQIKKLENTKINNQKTNPNANPMKEQISFDDFTKIDLRTATILEAEKVEKADKLLKLKVDTGVDVRTVVSGIAESFSPEEIIGKQVMILLNLAPRKIRGIESQGMLLLTTKPDGKLSFVTPDEKVENGIEIG